MSTWFISDLHLAPEETRITAGFLDFMLEPQAGDSLYILGDFFNYWIGDDVKHPYIQQIQQVLKATKDRGVDLYFMHGNRDFLIGDAFCKASGMTLLNDPTVITLNGEPVVLMHGDSLCTRDEAYMAFRKMARDPQWQQQFLSQSIEERIAFAQKARDESQSSNSMKDESIMDVTPTEVDIELTKLNSKRMIHGHTHRPAIHNWQFNGNELERIVLGDWYEKGWYLKVENGQYDLVEFDLPAV
ncbi:MAG: UDP-2,3-diacylglucosamine diphosphatase [Bermanella sp.]